VSLRPTGLDQYYNPVAVDVEAVQWEAAPALGSINKLGVFTAASVKEPTVGLVLARMGKMTASSVVNIAPGPTRVVVTPASVSLSPGATQQFVAEAYDEDNDQLAVSPGRIVWRAEPAGAKISASGLLKAPAQNATLAVLACVGDVCGRAEVVVGEEVALVETFEKPGQWRYRAEPASAPGGLDWAEDRLRPRNHCLQLRYDLSQGAGTRAAYADLDLQLPEAGALSVNVLGDGQGAWLRARLRDGAGRVFSLDLAKAVSWSGSWRRLTAPLPAEAESPVTLECVYLAEIHDEHKPTGAIWLDDIAVGRAPAVGGGAAANPAGKGTE
jgi:plastocyanin